MGLGKAIGNLGHRSRLEHAGQAAGGAKGEHEPGGEADPAGEADQGGGEPLGVDEAGDEQKIQHDRKRDCRRQRRPATAVPQLG